MVENNLYMTGLQKFTLEFPIKASPKVLFTLVGTGEGLARWFADKVSVKEDLYLFQWEGSEQSAKLLERKESEFILFEWADDFHQGYNLEIRITHEPVSGESALIITDYAEASDVEFTERWWNNQVGRLQRLFNS